MTSIEFILLVLNGLILPLTAWVLHNVTALQKSLAVTVVHGQNHAAEIVELRARVTACEAHIVELRIQISNREGNS